MARCKATCYGTDGRLVDNAKKNRDCKGCPQLRAPRCAPWCAGHVDGDGKQTGLETKCSWDTNACSGCDGCDKPAPQLGTRRLGDPEQVALFTNKDNVHAVCVTESPSLTHNTLYLSQRGRHRIIFGKSTWLTAETPATGIRPGHLFERTVNTDTLRTTHRAWCRIDPAHHLHNDDRYTSRWDEEKNVEWVVAEIPHYVTSSTTTPDPPAPSFLENAFDSNKKKTTIYHVGMLIGNSGCSIKAKLKSCLATGQHTSQRCLSLVDSNTSKLPDYFSDAELRKRAMDFCSVPGHMAKSEQANAELPLCQRIAARHPAGFLGTAVTRYCNEHARGADDPFCGCFPRYWERRLKEKIPDLHNHPEALQVARSAMQKENPRCQLTHCTSDDAYKRNTSVCPSSSTQVCIQKLDAAVSAGEVASIGLTCFGSDGQSPAPSIFKQLEDWIKKNTTAVAITSSVAIVVILLLVLLMVMVSRRRSRYVPMYI